MTPSRTQLQIGELWDATTVGSVPALGLGTVHLWQRPLHSTAAELAASYELLSNDEKERALRFRIERTHVDYVLTRGTLRLLLAQYLGTSPHEVHFRYGLHAKPLLEGDNRLRFNVSHTHGLAMMAFTRDRAIGVDVENVTRSTDVERLAERFFSQAEREALMQLPAQELRAAFFRCWTRKEAYIKAKGDGLSLPLREFDVSITLGDRDALLATRPDPTGAAGWTICDISVGPEFAAAVAVAPE
ncbi:MAG TPA: 4'-phosphopantetheinyl transferase superfamily protein [Candidatus Binatia bacterium]|nr:4'-phosphopantetheinyl transferase superfamily protein [Candidatus Binatia bacterium]